MYETIQEHGILALDDMPLDVALAWARDQGPNFALVKVNMLWDAFAAAGRPDIVALAQLITSELENDANLDRIRQIAEQIERQAAMNLVGALKEKGARGVFVDLKFHDIPNTDAGRAMALLKAGANMITMHCDSGVTSMRQVMEDVEAPGVDALVLGITVLTSKREEELKVPVVSQVLEYARHAAQAGIDGIVCSAEELKMLSSHRELDGLKRVVPGTRFSDGDTHDQARVMTPYEAMALGADYLVIGRMITTSGNLDKDLERLESEMKQGREVWNKK